MRHQELLQVINLLRQVWIETARIDPAGELADFTVDVLNHIAYLYKVAVRWRDEDAETEAALDRIRKEAVPSRDVYDGLFPGCTDVPVAPVVEGEQPTQRRRPYALGKREIYGSD